MESTATSEVDDLTFVKIKSERCANVLCLPKGKYLEFVLNHIHTVKDKII